MPFKVLSTTGVRYNRSGIALHIIGFVDFIKDRPADGSGVERIKNDITLPAKTGVVPTIGVGDDGTVTAVQSAGQHFGNRHRLARLGGSAN